MKTKISLLVVLLATGTFTSPRNSMAAYFNDPSLDPEVQAAHETFIAGDFGAMAIHVKAALMAHPDDEAIKSNVLGLIDQAYEVKGARAIPADWKAPASIHFMNLSVTHKQTLGSNRVKYQLALYAETNPGTELEQLQLIQYPGKVILDKRENIGYFQSGNEIAPTHEPYTSAYSVSTAEAPQDGLYLLNIQTKDGESMQGWVILTGLISSTLPIVTTPTPELAFTTANPTFNWQQFYSPEYRNFEERALFLGVTVDDPNATDDEWEFFSGAPKLQWITLGTGHNQSGVTSLVDGKYSLTVSYRERRHFGDLILSRTSKTQVPFSVHVNR